MQIIFFRIKQEVEIMIYNDENAQHIKNYNGSMRILEYLECYKDGCIFDDIFYDLSKHIPNLTIAYVLSIVEVLKEEKYITCSKREGFHYYNISDIGIELLAVEKEKSERKKSQKNTSSNSNDFQTVGKLIQTSEDFIKSLESVFETRKKDIISSNQNEIAEKKLLKENLKSEIKELSFFDFKTKRAKKDELKTLKTTISTIKKYKYVNDLINAEKAKLDQIKNDYIAEINLFLDKRCRVPLKQQYDMYEQLQIEFIQSQDIEKDIERVILEYLYTSGAKTVYDLVSYCCKTLYDCTPRYMMGIIRPLLKKNLLSQSKEYGMTFFYISNDISNDLKKIKKKGFTMMLLKYLYISGKKSPNELAEYFKTIIPHCTPQFIMAIIKPVPHINHIIDSVVKTEEKCVAYFQIKDLDFMKENPRWYEKEIKENDKSPFSKWYFLKDDLIFENEQVPQIPKI